MAKGIEIIIAGIIAGVVAYTTSILGIKGTGISWNGKAGAALIETPAHSFRFAQPYSSWGCSPAEPHYASSCTTKVAISSQKTKQIAENVAHK